MDIFYHAAVIWFIIGFIFFLLEFVIPGLILFFFAVGAWIVAILCLYLEPSINTQLLIFLGSSLLTIVVFRSWVKKLISSKQNSTQLEDEFLGKQGIAETFIGPGTDGKVDFKGTRWNARSNDIIEKGDKVFITGNESILLIVQSTKTQL